MADQMPILNRQQLAQFLPSHEAIKAFESLFKYVSQTAPETNDDFSALAAAIKSPSASLSAIQQQIELIQQDQRRNRNTQDEILRRLDQLETLLGVK